MKKKFRIVALAMMLLMLGLMLASCANTLSGTYSNGVDVLGTGAKLEYTFSGSNVSLKVTTSLLGATAEKTLDGTYTIDDATNESGDKTDSKTITLTFGGEDAVAAVDYSGTFSFKEDDSSITIGGVQYIKQK